MSSKDGVVKDLYKLVGKYDEHSEATNKAIEELKNQIADFVKENRAQHEKITKSITMQELIDVDHEARIKNMEKSGIPRNTKIQILANTVLSAINLIGTFALQYKYGLGVGIVASGLGIILAIVL